MDNWRLPDHVDDVLPAEAARLEALRRTLLDLFRVHGFELVVPPLIEYVESLLTGSGRDLDLITFKLVDQMSGRLLGVRADITPQAARIDAHILNRAGVTRLCYGGSVLHAMPTGAVRRRELIQVGAELYGHGGIESDIEIQRLMLEALGCAGCRDLQLDLGHVAPFRSLIARGGLGPEHELALSQALQGKDLPELRERIASLPEQIGQALLALGELYGGVEVLREARRRLPDFPEIGAALDDLEHASRALEDLPVTCSFDLGELRGYHYHTGIVFTAYREGYPDAIGRGGRYDEIGRAFGRARPATGFTLDLRDIAAIGTTPTPLRGIRAPCAGDGALRETIASLRRAGEIVIVELPGQGHPPAERSVDRELKLVDGRWQLVPFEPPG
jgi:ATP phosphoribosyltransferase regulatory subunit